MKPISFLLFLAVLCISPAAHLHAAPLPASYQTEADRLTKDLPSLYWYASDTCLRETSRHGPQTLKYEAFVYKNRATIQKATPLPGANPPRVDYQISLVDPADPAEHWIFEFIYDGQKWEAKSAFKYFGQQRAFDLYAGDMFLGSMKPYIQKALDTFTRHGNLAAAFPASAEAIKSQMPAAPFKVGDIIEQYQYYEQDDGFFPGQTKSFARTKWKVREIASAYVELELVEGRIALQGNESKGPGFVLRLASSKVYREAFPDASPIQEILESYKKVDVPPR